LAKVLPIRVTTSRGSDSRIMAGKRATRAEFEN